MGSLWSALFGKRETVIKGPGDRVGNLCKNNFHGLLGVLVPIIVLAVLVDKKKTYKTVGGIWFWMLWFLIFQPIPQNAVGIIPLFAFPLFGSTYSTAVVSSYINEMIILFFIGGWLLMALNCCGLDKRIALSFLCCGGDTAYSCVHILLKSMMASFFLSMLSCRTLAIPVLLDIILPPLQKLEGPKSDINYTNYIAILCNAIATSSILGSMCIVHASITTLQFKSFHSEMSGLDIFNYLQYSAFTVPIAVVMLILNILYHVILIKCGVESKKKLMTKYSSISVKNAVTNIQKEQGSMKFHHRMTSLLLALCLALMFTRWSKWLNMGWSTFRREGNMPGVGDATTAALLAFAFFIIPNSFDFFKICSVKEEKDAPLKMASGLLFWKYVDKHLDYSYFLIFGAGLALQQAVTGSGLNGKIKEEMGNLTNNDWNLGIFIIVLCSVILANIMSGVGAQAMLMPLFIAIAQTGKDPYPKHVHLVVLGIGLATGFGAIGRFRDTPSYFGHKKGKVSCANRTKFAIASTVICTLILWLALCFYAPLLWESENISGVVTEPEVVIDITTPPPKTTQATTASTEGDEG